ncbi:MAG: biotin/lipoyl-binding protein, partial [Desulforhopalus sp.]|nr:biotin/lipoyl-binding protein [Desulforhopalus sp.]
MKMKSLLRFLTPVLLSTALLIGCGQEPPKKEIVRFVRTMKIVNPADVGTRSFPGRAKAVQEVNLSFRVSGPLVERPVDVGSKITKGDLVAKIDPRDFQVNLNDAQGKLAKAK